MPRQYAKVFTSIWADDDFRKLPAEAQRLYFLLVSQPEINNAGVLMYTPKRWARMALDTKPAVIGRAVTTLAVQRFILVDTDTEEVWVRTYARHDGVLSTPQLVRAMWRDAAAVQSPAIRRAFAQEYDPPASDPSPDPSPNGSTDTSEDPSADPSRDPPRAHAGVQQQPPTTTYQQPTANATLVLVQPPPLPAAHASGGGGFAAFWSSYPRKVGRGRAVKAWGNAVKRAQAETIIEALDRHVEAWKRARTESSYIPHPATWLNDDRWTDESLPVNDDAPMKVSNGTAAALRNMQRAVEREGRTL